jgi:site-specific DNA-methyltransferase (adenine-specific)
MKTAVKPVPKNDDPLLPPLTPEQRNSLRDSIRAEGIHTPIVQDQHGQVIDGFERLSIAEELGLRTYPVRTVHCPDECTRRHLRLQLNCNRRQLTRQQKRQVIAQELVRSPELSDRFIGSLIGASHRTVASIRVELERTGQIAHLPAKLGLDGKRRRLPVIPTESKAKADRAARVLRSIPDPPARPMKLAVAERLARSEKLRAATDSKGLPSGVEVFCSDFRQLELRDASVDLIFSDPPWSQPDLYTDLARFAARVLKPGRLCCVYAPAATLPEIIAGMGKHLDYYWCLAVGYQNARCHRNARVSFTGTWTPILAFCKGPVEKRTKNAPLDFLSASCGRSDKHSYHRWQQEGEPARYWLERLTLPGDVILDPLCGSGQFALETVRIGDRRIIACDIDPEAAETTRRRLARASEKAS